MLVEILAVFSFWVILKWFHFQYIFVLLKFMSKKLCNLMCTDYNQSWLFIQSTHRVVINEFLALFQPIERRPRVFAPLVIPRELQKALPFAVKPKVPKPVKDSVQSQRVAIVREPKERQVCSHASAWDSCFNVTVTCVQLWANEIHVLMSLLLVWANEMTKNDDSLADFLSTGNFW